MILRLKHIMQFTFFLLYLAQAVYATKAVSVVINPQPAEVANSVIKGLLEHKPIVAWNALPHSFQSDVNNFIYRYVRLIDRDNFVLAVNVYRRFVIALKLKRKLIVSLMVDAFPDDNRKGLEENLDSLIIILTIVGKSQFSNYNNFRKPDIGKFIDQHGKSILDALTALTKMGDSGPGLRLQSFVNIKAVQLSRNGNSAIIGLIEKGKGGQGKETFVRVEGKWIPQGLQRGWKKGFALANLHIMVKPSNIKAENTLLRKKLVVIEEFVALFERIDSKKKLASIPVHWYTMRLKIRELIKNRE